MCGWSPLCFQEITVSKKTKTLPRAFVARYVKKISLFAEWEDGDPTIVTVSRANEEMLDGETFSIVKQNLSNFDEETQLHFKSFIEAKDGDGLREAWNEHHIESGEACRISLVESRVLIERVELGRFVIRDDENKFYDTTELLSVAKNELVGLGCGRIIDRTKEDWRTKKTL